MDKSAEESARKIFELVGQAIFSAQLMEKEMAFLIMIPEITKNKKLPDSFRISQEIEKLDNCTLGQLLKKLKHHAVMSKEMEKILSKALEKRNFLAHSFFHSYVGWLGDISKHNTMREELEKMRDMFKFIYDKLYRESYRNLKKIGLI